MSEWLRETERPEYGRDDVEWWWRKSDSLRLAEGQDELERRCRIRGCSEPVSLVYPRTAHRWSSDSTYELRDFRCAGHIYGEILVEGGVVYEKRPRMDDVIA